MDAKVAAQIMHNIVASPGYPAVVHEAAALAAMCLEEHERRAIQGSGDRPVVTTLCGSSRFPDLHMQVMMALTMQGRVVIPMGCYGHADFPVGARFLTSDGDEMKPEKQQLDELHFRKIEMSDGIYVVNPGGYVGNSTKREIDHATKLNKSVEYLFPK